MFIKESPNDFNMDDIQCDNDNSIKTYSKFDLNTITRGINHIQYALFNTPSGSHNLLVYSDIRVLRATYPAYVKSLLEDNEIVLILTYYDHPSMVRQILELGSKKNNHTDTEKYLNEGSLVIVDSQMTYFNPLQNNQINNINVDNEKSKTNFLSLIRMLFNHGVKNNKKGITILSDMGSFFNYGYSHRYNNDGNHIIHNIMEFEKSIPFGYRDLQLKEFCLYHQRDYELHFASKRQKAQLLDCHSQSILNMDGTNNNSSSSSSNNDYNN
ncbi:MAG TPA: hypothetical protein VH500_09655 [Nitrososphaeraceae archaeon]|jgi:hypothetical protein